MIAFECIHDSEVLCFLHVAAHDKLMGRRTLIVLAPNILVQGAKVDAKAYLTRILFGATTIAAHQGIGSVTGRIMPRSCKSCSSLRGLFISGSGILLGVVTEKGTAFGSR